MSKSSYAQKFESLGDNCEFGFIQRTQGYEDGGLFRWARIKKIDDVVNIIANDFVDVYLFENLTPMNLDMIRDDKYGILFHSEVLSKRQDGIWITEMSDEEQKRIYKREYTKRLHLVEKTRHLLKTAEKHFIFKMNERVAVEKVRSLFQAIRRFGNRNLLFVQQGNEEENGGVKMIEDGLYCGTILKFAPYEKANEFRQDDWSMVCLNYLQLVD